MPFFPLDSFDGKKGDCYWRPLPIFDFPLVSRMLSRLLPPSFKISNIGKSLQKQLTLFPKAYSFQAQSLLKSNTTRSFSNLGQLFTANKINAKKCINQYTVFTFEGNSTPRKVNTSSFEDHHMTTRHLTF